MSVHLLLALGALAAPAACDNSASRVEAPPKAMALAPELASGAAAVEHAYVPTIDPATMTDAEIAQVVPAARRCAFRYTRNSDPVLATDGTRGVVKVNGDLVALSPARTGDPARGGALSADDLRLTVRPLPDEDTGEADVRFEVASGPGLRVDYRGFYRCAG